MVEGDPGAQYPIRTVSRRTGLSPDVLRAWERRYGAVEPQRREGGRRLYTNDEIARFDMLRRLTEAGHAIGRIARLPSPELLALLQREEATARAAGPRVPRPEADRYLQEALATVESMDGRALQRTLMRAVVALSSRDFVDALVLPLLRQVGELWATGGICPAHEHVVSVQVSRVLGWVSATVPVAEDAPRAVAATPAGQRHEFGALLAAIAAAEEGWRVTYLGPDLSGRDIATAVTSLQANLLLLSAVLEDSSPALLADLREVRARVGGEPRILVGGSATGPLQQEIEKAGASWLPDLDALRVALRESAPSGRHP